jgi:hypothetical protein
MAVANLKVFDLFVLEVGVKVKVPVGIFLEPAHDPRFEGGDTPMVARLLRMKKSKVAFDVHASYPRGKQVAHGKVAIVPAGLQAGETLQLVWIASDNRSCYFQRVEAENPEHI